MSRLSPFGVDRFDEKGWGGGGDPGPRHGDEISSCFLLFFSARSDWPEIVHRLLWITLLLETLGWLPL